MRLLKYLGQALGGAGQRGELARQTLRCDTVGDWMDDERQLDWIEESRGVGGQRSSYFLCFARVCSSAAGPVLKLPTRYGHDALGRHSISRPTANGCTAISNNTAIPSCAECFLSACACQTRTAILGAEHRHLHHGCLCHPILANPVCFCWPEKCTKLPPFSCLLYKLQLDGDWHVKDIERKSGLLLLQPNTNTNSNKTPSTRYLLHQRNVPSKCCLLVDNAPVLDYC